MIAGRLPHVPELLDSDGLTLRKPAGGIQPIAIGEAWLRLAALCAVNECHDLAPLQLGVGISAAGLPVRVQSQSHGVFYTSCSVGCVWGFWRFPPYDLPVYLRNNTVFVSVQCRRSKETMKSQVLYTTVLLSARLSIS
jgi:hypothetical protein